MPDLAIAVRFSATNISFGVAQSTIRRVNAPATIPSRNALEIARRRIVLKGSSDQMGLVAALAHGDVR